MDIVNILIAGVGGQGLVLTTDIIAQAAFLAGYEVATNDVIGLSQRGGKINGSVRFGKKVPTPNVPEASGSVLLGLEKLETLRFVDQVIPGGTVLMNSTEIYPNPVLMEKAHYPQDIEAQIKARAVKLVVIDSEQEAARIGNPKVANTILLGALSTLVDIDPEHFIKAIQLRVPPKTVAANLEAFAFGRKIMGAATDPVTPKAPPELPDELKPIVEVSTKPPHPEDPAGYEVETAPDAPVGVAGPMNTEMPTWVCTVCGFAYDPVTGDPEHGVASGTLFEAVPPDWTCPLCGVGKALFEKQ